MHSQGSASRRIQAVGWLGQSAAVPQKAHTGAPLRFAPATPARVLRRSLAWIARFAPLAVLFSAGTAKAVEPALVFGDQMVLQRGVSVPIWGRAEPGEQVTVSFAGQSAKATADARGLWRGD